MQTLTEETGNASQMPLDDQAVLLYLQSRGVKDERISELASRLQDSSTDQRGDSIDEEDATEQEESADDMEKVRITAIIQLTETQDGGDLSSEFFVQHVAETENNTESISSEVAGTTHQSDELYAPLSVSSTREQGRTEQEEEEEEEEEEEKEAGGHDADLSRDSGRQSHQPQEQTGSFTNPTERNGPSVSVTNDTNRTESNDRSSTPSRVVTTSGPALAGRYADLGASLVVAEQVSSTEMVLDGSIVPITTEHTAQEDLDRMLKRRKRLFTGAALGLILFVVIVVVMVTLLTRPNEKVVLIEPTSESPSMSPTLNPEARATHIRNALSALSLNGSVWDTPGTPQQLALLWLTEDDDFLHGIENDNQIQQRYSLSVLYFATGGNSTWSNTGAFLGPMHECDWMKSSMSCNGSGFVTELVLREFVQNRSQHCLTTA